MASKISILKIFSSKSRSDETDGKENINQKEENSVSCKCNHSTCPMILKLKADRENLRKKLHLAKQQRAALIEKIRSFAGCEIENLDLPCPVDHSEDLASPGSSGATLDTIELPHISYKDLEHVTGFWNIQNIIGRGGFGVVFKATWKNTQVAIKRLQVLKAGSKPEDIHEKERDQFLREMKFLRSNPHPNILPLYGHSVDGEHPCLIYQYMEYGSLQDRLLCRGNSPVLLWHQRLKIAHGTSGGIQFLHTIRDNPLIHGDIKSANILLDTALVPRIGDFGLAREGPLQSERSYFVVSSVSGTQPYLPEEYLRSNKLSPKVDTYSFGVVLFELATGFRAYDGKRSPKYLVQYVIKCSKEPLEEITRLGDQRLQIEPYIFKNLLRIGKRCVLKYEHRPYMVDVFKDLSRVQTELATRNTNGVPDATLTPPSSDNDSSTPEHRMLITEAQIEPAPGNLRNLPDLSALRMDHCDNENNSAKPSTSNLDSKTDSSSTGDDVGESYSPMETLEKQHDEDSSNVIALNLPCLTILGLKNGGSSMDSPPEEGPQNGE